MAPHGWGNPAGRVDTPTSPVLPLEGPGHVTQRSKHPAQQVAPPHSGVCGVSSSSALVWQSDCTARVLTWGGGVDSIDE